MAKLKAMKIRKWYVKYQSTEVTHRHIKVDLFQMSFNVLEKEGKHRYVRRLELIAWYYNVGEQI